MYTPPFHLSVVKFRLAKFKFSNCLSFNTTVSGRIQQGVKLFASVELHLNLVMNQFESRETIVTQSYTVTVHVNTIKHDIGY